MAQPYAYMYLREPSFDDLVRCDALDRDARVSVGGRRGFGGGERVGGSLGISGMTTCGIAAGNVCIRKPACSRAEPLAQFSSCGIEIDLMAAAILFTSAVRQK